MSLSYSQIVTSFTIWDFLSELTKSFTQMDIYKAGIIDSQGRFLKQPQEYKTENEKRAGNSFYRLIVVLKRALLTSSDPKIRFSMNNPMAALGALSEEVESLGGDGQAFIDSVYPLIEEMSVGAGGIVGVGVPADKPEDVVVPPSAAARHKKRAKKQTVGRKIFEQLMLEAKRVVETTGHMTHLGDFLYHGSPETAIQHLESTHGRFRGKTTPNHSMSLKADGGMSVVLKRHASGEPAVAYKSGAEEFKTEDQIRASGKEHFVRELIPALHLARKINLKPGTAVQGDLLFSSKHSGTVQPNTITYQAPHGAEIGFAAHSAYKTDGLNLRKTSSQPEQLSAEGAFIPHLAITPKTKLSISPERHKKITAAITSAKKILADKKVNSFLRGLPSNKKFHRMLQEYSNHAARTTGHRTVEGLQKFIDVHMAKASQRNLSEKTKKSMVDSFHGTINTNKRELAAAFTAHSHINDAKHHLLDQFKEHHDQFELKTHGGEEHEGFVSALGKPGVSETQAKFVREGEGGFPAKNTENAIRRFGKPADA